MHRLVGLALLFSLLASPLMGQDYFRPKITAKEIEASLRTDWFGLYLQGKKIGYFQSNRVQQEDTVVDSFLMQMKLVSFGQKVEMYIRQNVFFEAKAPFRMIKGIFEQTDGGNKTIIQVERQGEGFQLSHEVAGQRRVNKVKDLQFDLVDAIASEVWLMSKPNKGDSIRYKDFDLQEWKIDDSSSKILAQKDTLVAGVQVHYYEVETITRQEMLRLLSRHDDKGHMLSGQFAIFELRKEPEEQAKNTQFSQDLFVLGMAKIDKSIGRTTDLTELVLDLDAREGNLFESGPNQTLEMVGADQYRLKLGKKYGKEIKATEKEVKDSLEETNSYPFSHPKIQELAEKAVGDAKDPLEKARRIAKFVHRFVEPNLSVNLPNIHDLMARKKGDCKSYALLFNNLARANGIPAREVSGLLYMGDDAKAFGGHAWNEIVLDGVWVPVDASLGQVGVDAGHICFGPNQTATKNLLESMGKLSFKVVEAKTK